MSLLAIYLNDHLAGAAGGVELARRAHGSNQGTEYGVTLAELVAEIEADREALEELMEELDISRDRIKGVLAWTAEKVGRLKLNGSLLSYSPLSRLVELEGLVIGVTGKRSMWVNAEATLGPRVGPIEFAKLIARADSQIERLTELRTRAAAEALEAP